MRRWDRVLGMNARNDVIARRNPQASIALVNDKEATKQRLRRVGAPVPRTLAVVADGRQLRDLQVTALPDAWACKPNRSLGGAGILLVDGRHPAGGFRKLSGRFVSGRDVAGHVRSILDGEYSPGGRDSALFEPLLRPHDVLAGLAPAGLPDVRVLCHGDDPVLAMLRLPTEASDGRANLHAGGIGAAVDLETGVITAALQHGRPVHDHPETGSRLVGVGIPEWPAVLAAARRCADATGLSYLGVDVVVDANEGPLILEVNARPGLEIQNVTTSGLVGAATG